MFWIYYSNEHSIGQFPYYIVTDLVRIMASSKKPASDLNFVNYTFERIDTIFRITLY